MWISSHPSKRIRSLPKPANHPWVYPITQRGRPNRSLLSTPRQAMRALISRRSGKRDSEVARYSHSPCWHAACLVGIVAVVSYPRDLATRQAMPQIRWNHDDWILLPAPRGGYLGALPRCGVCCLICLCRSGYALFPAPRGLATLAPSRLALLQSM